MSARLTHGTSDVQQTTCLLQVMRVWESKENICGAFCNMIIKTLVLTALRWTELREPWLAENWNSAEYYAAYRHAKRPEWRDLSDEIMLLFIKTATAASSRIRRL